MGAIAAMYSLDDRLVDRALLRRMNERARLLTPSIPALMAGRRAGLCWRDTEHGGLTASVESVRGPGDLSLWGVADARIDNRPELIQSLSQWDASERDTDVALILKAFGAWGIPGLRRIVGDFVVVIWDEANDRLVCARDPVGVKPLYVRIASGRLTVASQIPQLLVAAERTPDLNLEYVADHLAFGVPRANGVSTPYEGITRLAPGHAVVAERQTARVVRYWDWNVTPALTYQRDDDYALHFLSLFTDAVRGRLRTPGPVWADLSGGLDSSSIVCVASELLGQQPGRQPLSTVSIVFDRAATSDERHWADHVRRKYGLTEHFIDGDRRHAMRAIGDVVEDWDEPHPSIVFADMHRGYRELFASNGLPVLLSGAGAEAVILERNEAPIHLADLFARCRFVALARELREWQRAMRIPFSNLFLRYAVRPWLGPHRITYNWQRTVHSWIRPDFSRRFGLPQRARHGTMPKRFTSPADQLQYEKIGRVPGFLTRGHLEKCCDVRYPFLHRPLIEFMLQVPWDAKLRAGEGKPILRNSMRGLLPEAVRTRKATSSFDHGVYLGIQKEWPSIEALIRSSHLADLGCIAPKALLQAAQLARCGHAPDLHGLISTLSLEAWLQGAFARAPRATRRPAPALSSGLRPAAAFH